MSKAVRFHQVGGPEVLKIEEVSTRDPQAGEVAIDVAAVGLNRAESMYYRGHYFEQPVFPSRTPTGTELEINSSSSECEYKPGGEQQQPQRQQQKQKH